MSAPAIIVLPVHLFENNELIANNPSSVVYIYEHPVYFTMYKYHKLKLILHRATMRFYADFIIKKYSCVVRYLEYTFDITEVFKKYPKVYMYDPVDFAVRGDFASYDITYYESPQFLCTTGDLDEFANQSEGKLNQTSFYIWQRKRLKILVDSSNKPEGGKWTYDTANRKSFPSTYKENLDDMFVDNNQYVDEATKYVNTRFYDNPGSDLMYLPITFDEIKQHFKLFLLKKLGCFGEYQDAVRSDVIFGCHSVLSPFINIGMLTPHQVVSQALTSKAPLTSLEGFIRQIIGWREYMRYVYIFKHEELIAGNHFKYKRKIPKNWRKTGILPIDDIIDKVHKYGYAHHIERLMYIGNFTLLAGFKPADVHDWFMMMFIDSYHVFMEPNVYGMSQYSCGMLMSTRPYFCSSNYYDKMSDYHKIKGEKVLIGDKKYEWYEIVDALYYSFINDNAAEFSKNYSTASSVKHWNNKKPKDKKILIEIASKYKK